MSASVYANPYTYRPPPPRINYPPLFSGLNDLTFRYFLDSKILALAVLVLGAGVFVDFIVILTPFWFTLSLDDIQGTFGSEPVVSDSSFNAGLFYLRAKHMDNAVFLDKYTNQDTVPPVLKAGQVFGIAGTCLLWGCFFAGLILLFRRFASVTALIVLAGASTLAAVLKVLVILCCAVVVVDSSCEPKDSGCNYNDNLAWRMIPMDNQFYRVEPKLTPYVEADWAFFMAIFGAIICIAGAVMVWIEAIFNMKKLGEIRYQQLKEFRDPYEKERDAHAAHPGSRFMYQPPVRGGPNTYGMQPVIPTDPHNYEGMIINPGGAAPYIPPATFHPPPPQRPPSPGFERRHRDYAPSVTSSNSEYGRGGGGGTREINL